MRFESRFLIKNCQNQFEEFNEVSEPIYIQIINSKMKYREVTVWKIHTFVLLSKLVWSWANSIAPSNQLEKSIYFIFSKNNGLPRKIFNERTFNTREQTILILYFETFPLSLTSNDFIKTWVSEIANLICIY